MRLRKVYKPKRLSGLSPRAWTLIELGAIFVALAACVGLVALAVL